MRRGNIIPSDSDEERSTGIPGSVSPCTPQASDSVLTTATLGDGTHMAQNSPAATDVASKRADEKHDASEPPEAKRPRIGQKTGGICMNCRRDAYCLEEAEVPVCCLSCDLSQGTRHTFECNLAYEDDVTPLSNSPRTADLKRVFSLRGIKLDQAYSDPTLITEGLSKHYQGRLPDDQSGPWSFSIMAKCLDRADPSKWTNFLGPVLQEYLPSGHLAQDPNISKSELRELRQQDIANWCADLEQASLPHRPPSEVVTEAIWEICCALETSISDPVKRRKQMHIMLWYVHERMSMFARGLLETTPLLKILQKCVPDDGSREAAETLSALAEELRISHGIPMEWLSEQSCRKISMFPMRNDEEIKRCILREPTKGPVDDESDVEYDDVRTPSGTYDGANIGDPHWCLRIKFIVNGSETHNFLYKYDRFTRIGSVIEMLLSEINGEWNSDAVDVRAWDAVYPFPSSTHMLNWTGDRKHDLPQTVQNTKPRMLSPDAQLFTAMPPMGAMVVTATNRSYARDIEQKIAHTLSRNPDFQEYYYNCKAKGATPLAPMLEHDLRDRRGRPFTRHTARCITAATLTWIDHLAQAKSGPPKLLTVEDEELDLPDFDLDERAYNVEHHHGEAQIQLVDPLCLVMNPEGHGSPKHASALKAAELDALTNSQREVTGMVGSEYFIPLMERYQGNVFGSKKSDQKPAARWMMPDIDLVLELQLHHCVNIRGISDYSKFGPHCHPVHSQLNIQQVIETVMPDPKDDSCPAEADLPLLWRRSPAREILLPLPFKSLERVSQHTRFGGKRSRDDRDDEPSSSEAKLRRGFSIKEKWDRWMNNALDKKLSSDQELEPKKPEEDMNAYLYKFLLHQLSCETEVSERQRLNSLRYQILTSEFTGDEEAKTYLCDILGMEADNDKAVEDPCCTLVEATKHYVFGVLREWVTPFDIADPAVSSLNSRLRLARLKALLHGHPLETAEEVNRAVENAILHDALTILKTRDCQAFEFRQWLQNALGVWPESVQPWHITNPTSIDLSNSLHDNLVTFAKDVCRRHVSDEERALADYFKSSTSEKVAHALFSYASQGLGETTVPGRHLARIARYKDGYIGVRDHLWERGEDPLVTCPAASERIERQQQLSPEESRVRLAKHTDALRSRIDDAKQVSANQQVRMLLESLNTRKCETQGRAKYEKELDSNISIPDLLKEAAEKMTDEHERGRAMMAIDDLRRAMNSDSRPERRAHLTPARPQERRSSTSSGNDRPNLYQTRGEEKRSGVEERTKPLQPEAQRLIETCKGKEFWAIYNREAAQLGFTKEHQLCINYTLCGRHAEIRSVDASGAIKYRSHCCIACRDTKGLADFAMGHAVECNGLCGKLGAIFTTRGLARPNDRKAYLESWKSECVDIIRRMDKKYTKLKEAGIQVPAGWIVSDDSRKKELRAFAKGKGHSFFPRGWLMTADMFAEAQATGYTLPDVVETPGNSSSSGRTQGSEASNPSASSSGTEEIGNVPNSAQETSSSAGLQQNAGTNDESPSAHTDGEDEAADYASAGEE